MSRAGGTSDSRLLIRRFDVAGGEAAWSDAVEAFIPQLYLKKPFGQRTPKGSGPPMPREPVSINGGD
jgi:hypothetical protein